MTLALFDFDGTITNQDSFLKFIRFVVGDAKFVVGLIILSPILIAFKLKIIPNYKAKSIVISYFFKGYKEVKFKNLACEFSISQIDKIVRPKAKDRLIWHKDQGHKIVIVSASIDYWIYPWCFKNGFELLATKLETKDGLLTGNLLGNNCYGIEKACRIKQNYDLSQIEYIYAYGDSNGDKEMLEVANKSFYKFFN
jgi:HAD superfamily hydrolase (TIGR01490 family)